MTKWRTCDEQCPIPPRPLVHMNICQPCDYFRGASSPPGVAGWKINCNWPRNGSDFWQPSAPLDDLAPEAIRRLVGQNVVPAKKETP